MTDYNINVWWSEYNKELKRKDFKVILNEGT